MIGRINLEPEELELSAPLGDVQHIVDLYLAEKARSRAKTTAESLSHKLRFFLLFWEEAGPGLGWRLTPSALDQFNDWLDARQGLGGELLAWNTKNDALRRLRQFMRWGCERGHITDHRWPACIPAARGSAPVRSVFDLRSWRAIYRQCLASSAPTRDGALFAVLAGTGMRRGECVNLDFEDVDFTGDQSGFIRINTSKTGAGRIVAFDSITGRVLSLYMELFPRPGRSGPLFPTTYGRLKPAPLNRRLRHAADRAGLLGVYTGAHDFRRAFATFWTRALPGEGYGALLSRQLGHKPAGMTFSRYAQVDSEDIRRCMQKHRCSLFAQIMDAQDAN